MKEQLQRTRRPALFVAKPPTNKKRLLSDEKTAESVVCHDSHKTKQNPLQLPTHDTWRNLAEAAEEWRDLKGKYAELYQRINLSQPPCLMHKVCKLNIIGNTLTHAKVTI